MDEQERALLAAAAGAQGAAPAPDEAEQPAAVAGLTAAPEPPDEVRGMNCCDVIGDPCTAVGSSYSC